MTLQNVVRCSGGLLVAQRGATVAHPSSQALQVAEVREVRCPDTAPIEAQRSDEVVWRRHWAEAERLTIEFVDVAVVEVDDVGHTVTFDRELPVDLEQHLLFDHVLPLVLARRGELVLHGAVISQGGRGAVLVGDSGAGKSTLTAFAWQHGWTVGNDDGAVLFATKPPGVEPTYATLRLTPTSLEMLGLTHEPVSNVVGKVRLAGEGLRAFRQERVELGLIVVIDPVAAGEQARFEPLGGISAHAALFGSTFHADMSRDRRLPAIVEAIASIIEATTVGRLSVPRGLEGLAAAESLLRELLQTGSRLYRAAFVATGQSKADIRES